MRFFGSFAHGTVDEQSDLDVLILGEEPGPSLEPFRRALERLGALHRVEIDVVLARDAPHLAKGAIP